MALDIDSDRQALCEQDTVKLAKMGEELDAASEYIAILSGQLESAAEAQPAPSLVDPLERADRGALLQVVYNLETDNPGMSLSDALVYISGAFGGESDAPLLEPVDELVPYSEDAPPADGFDISWSPSSAADPELPYEEDAETLVLDSFEFDPTSFTPGGDSAADDTTEENPEQTESWQAPDTNEWQPQGPDTTEPWNGRGFQPWQDPEAEPADDEAPSWEPNQNERFPATEDTEFFGDAGGFGDVTGFGDPNGFETTSSEGLPDFDDEGPTQVNLPKPVSASSTIEDDGNWNPAAWVVKPDADAELNALLDQIEMPRDEVYGIRAFAKQHPELYKNPPASRTK